MDSVTDKVLHVMTALYTKFCTVYNLGTPIPRKDPLDPKVRLAPLPVDLEVSSIQNLKPCFALSLLAENGRGWCREREGPGVLRFRVRWSGGR